MGLMRAALKLLEIRTPNPQLPRLLNEENFTVFLKPLSWLILDYNSDCVDREYGSIHENGS